MPLTHSPLIEVKRTRHKGRGVFALGDSPCGTEIERVPVLVLPAGDIRGSHLASYCFLWSEGTVALPLGYGALYNHSYTPNAEYRDAAPQVKVYTALRDIRHGEEITINYNGSPSDDEPMPFPVAD